MAIGDKIQITDSSDSAKTGFFEFVSDGEANGDGEMAAISVFPNLPAWATTGDTVALGNPACKCVVVPGSHNPGTQSGRHVTGQTFQVIQKK